ncbi:MAG: flagellar biosynthesis repressor FlbT [Pseudomonadota bacterium]|nr:flagellar biosynthesis repressor FlbT [Pseudomonadota bacterium]
MSEFVLKLAPEERFYVNGTVFENGDEPGSFRVPGPDVRVLRSRDALQASDATTPVKQVYFTIQLLITRDLDEAETLPDLERACDELSAAFAPANPEIIPILQELIRRRNYFSALCYLKQIVALEAQLLGEEVPSALAA